MTAPDRHSPHPVAAVARAVRHPPASVRAMVRGALLDAAAVLFPVECAGCGSPDRSVCPACAALMVARVLVHHTRDGVPVYSALDYGGVVRRGILALKENGRTDVAGFLAPALAVAVNQARDAAGPGRTVEVVTVPTGRSAWRRRGYDPVRLLARRARPRPVRVLRIRPPARRQKTLSAGERASNLHGTMWARRRLDGRRFIVVDDVMTTGSTLSEAVRALEAAGGEVVSGACLAYTRLRS